MNNLALPLCPKCGDTKDVKYFLGHTKLAQPFACLKCKIYWATDLDIRELPPNSEKYVKDVK